MTHSDHLDTLLKEMPILVPNDLETKLWVMRMLQFIIRLIDEIEEEDAEQCVAMSSHYDGAGRTV